MIRAAVITISDRSSRGVRPDVSGPTLKALLVAAGAEVDEVLLIPDDPNAIAALLQRLADSGTCDAIFTTGGTGLSPRDVTPEATRRIIDRELPAMEAAIIQESLRSTPQAMLSRAVVGSRGRTLIVNFPGSPRAVKECFAVVAPVLRHAVCLLRDEDPHVAAVAAS